MSKTFPQESSEAFLNVKSLHYAEQKQLTSVFYQSALKSTSKKKTCFMVLENHNMNEVTSDDNTDSDIITFVE